jgi:peptidoglycan hydrolase-like protein with peptidoglycan-binding domain
MSALLGLYDTHPDIVHLQRFLNEKLVLDLNPDGNIGKISQQAIIKFQGTQGITEKDEYGACYGPLTRAIVQPFTDAKYLQSDAYQEAADLIGIEKAVVIAVTKVEAKQFGFLRTGFPVILFERHKFYSSLLKKRTRAEVQKLVVSEGDICNPESGGYLGGVAEIKRYSKAKAIDAEAAMLSTSWGLFQIMGFNFATAGYANVESYVADMFVSEHAQLKAFCNYIKNDKDGSLLKALKTKDWVAFAREYNGPAYERNAYHLKLPAEYKLALKKA